MALAQAILHTTEEIYALPEGQRAELIDGQMYMMAPPNRRHQEISGGFYHKIRSHIESKKGECEVYAAPFAVFLYDDDINYVEPDISVICDKSKLDDDGCHGAPDWIIEIVSPSTQRMDYGIKLYKYRTAGVREYWVVNPITRTVCVYDFAEEKGTGQYSFDDSIPAGIYEDFSICVSELLQ